jgi:hypothetical protein
MDTTTSVDLQFATFAGVTNTLQSIDITEITALDLGCVLVGTGVIAWLYIWHRNWVKRKGFRMVLKDRNDKIHAIWLEIIQDGIDDRLAKGKISNKEADAMFADAAYRMQLNDLIPTKRILKITKERLKRERAQRGVSPTPPKFTERLGKTVGKFWRRKAA